MTGLFPDWVLVASTMLAICVFVTGRMRLAAALSLPALLTFVIVPLALSVLSALPPILLVAIITLGLPFVVLRGLRGLLTLAVGKNAADHAMGDFLGSVLRSMWRRALRRRR